MKNKSLSSLAFNYIVNLLSRREYSEFELRNKMQEKNFSEEEIDEALSRCQAKNWQSDRRFSENYLNSRAKKRLWCRKNSTRITPIKRCVF